MDVENSTEDENVDENINFTHEELLEITNVALNELIAQDTFLNDFPKDVILEEVNNQIALLYGRSMTVYLLRDGGDRVPIIVPHATATVASLKKSIRRTMNLQLQRSGKAKNRKKLISWKYIWKTYHLKFGENILKDDNAKLSSLGIKNKSYIEFIKRKKKDLYSSLQ